MRVVCDTSVIIKFQRGGVIDCLGKLFDTVLIPQAIKDECRKPETKSVLQKPFFEVRNISRLLPLSGVHRGEQEVISLAVEQNITFILINDEKAFKRAIEQNLTPIRSFRVLLLAKKKGLIPTVKPVLDAMIANGEGIQKEIYRKTLDESGELSGTF
jgi:predicted nucleic acid-binding protein